MKKYVPERRRRGADERVVRAGLEDAVAVVAVQVDAHTRDERLRGRVEHAVVLVGLVVAAPEPPLSSHTMSPRRSSS